MIVSILKSEFVRFEERLESVSVDCLFEVALDVSAILVDFFVEVSHPDHHEFVVAACCKVISLLIKINSLDLSLMAVYCPS